MVYVHPVAFGDSLPSQPKRCSYCTQTAAFQGHKCGRCGLVHVLMLCRSACVHMGCSHCVYLLFTIIFPSTVFCNLHCICYIVYYTLLHIYATCTVFASLFSASVFVCRLVQMFVI